MVRFIVVTFAFLGWAFYELSGGDTFEPASAQLTNVTADPLKPAANVSKDFTDLNQSAEVTRVALNLTSVEDVLTGRAAVPVKLPQQDSEADAQVLPAVQQGEAIAIIPSLVEGADATVQPAVVTQAASVEFIETRTVSGNRVNVRGGPGTQFGVVGRVVRGDQVEILEDTGTGWVRFQTVDGATSGWLADFLLSDS